MTDAGLGIADLLAPLVAAFDGTALVAAVPVLAAFEALGSGGAVVDETVAVIDKTGADSDAANRNAGTDMRFMVAPFIGAAATSRGSRCRGRRSRR